MGNALQFRAYQPGDETAILDLFHKVFGKPFSADLWNWRFRDNPAGGPLIELAWDGVTLAGHYAVAPVAIAFAGEPRPTALSLTTMTHPNYRGQGLFTKLASTLYSRLADSGYVMVWGFPNDQSHRGIVRELAWSDIAEIPMFRLELASAPAARSAFSHISEIEGFDDSFDQLWQQFRFRTEIAVQRDRRYLDWRLGRNPLNRYRVLAYKEGQATLGYAAFKKFQEEMDLVEISTVEDLGVARELLAALIEVCGKDSLKAINAWVPVREPLHHEMEKRGFRNSVPITYFGARVFSDKAPEVTSVRNWYYSMMDSDVF